MFQEFGSFFHVSIGLADFVRNLFIAFVSGLIVSYFYKLSYRGPGYMNSFVSAMTLLSMITALVIMVIGNNLARAFGLVGAMSIIRFRTAVKETQDIIFIFFALAVGMAAGVGLYLASIAGALLIGLISVIISKSNLIVHSRKEFLLQFTLTSSDPDIEKSYTALLEKYCKNYRVINVKSIGENGDLELSFYVDLRKKSKAQSFISELKQIDGVLHVNIFFDEEFF